MQRINGDRGGLKAVGALNPGFGTVEQMSTADIIATINQTQPDILLVALGAKKGTQWIEHNRNRLNAKIISHLGTTINFMAGTVQRAPRLMRQFGMEWLWRICQEPKLFSRYVRDGLVLLRLFIQGAY
jgi:N-acetylglucosaminyldiphosphoundecaprenol N-acetyl-beta-D-mannosaminyltransferase